MNLGELIDTLAAVEDQTLVLPVGFTKPHSYRYYYDELAFEPATDITVADMLTAARSADGTTYQGWKGGYYTMRRHTGCWMSEEGSADGETISALLLKFLLAAARKPAGTIRHVSIDTEFLRHDLTSRGLVSIALTDDNGTDYYAVNSGVDDDAVHADPWMRDNVWPYLPQYADGVLDRDHPDVRPYTTIRDEIAAYFADTTATTTYLYANHGAQDAVRLHGLWDHDWGIMPEAIPRWFYDIKGLIAQAGHPDGIPEQESGAHHPLEDARHNQAVRRFLESQ